MKLQTYVWYDKDETEKDLIINVLNQWCVPYKTKTNRVDSLFGYSESYDIMVELDTTHKGRKKSPYDFIISKVKERLALEQCYEGRDAKRPPLKEETKCDNGSDGDLVELKAYGNNGRLYPSVPSLFEDFFEPPRPDNILLNISELLPKALRKDNKNLSEDLLKCKQDLKALIKEKEQYLNSLSFIDRVLYRILSWFKNSWLNKLLKLDVPTIEGLNQTLSDAKARIEELEKFENTPLPLETLINNPSKIPTHDSLINELGKILNGFVENSLNKGDIVKFDSLPKQVQNLLKKRLPEKVLRSNRCVIRAIKTPVGVSFTISLNGGGLDE